MKEFIKTLTKILIRLFFFMLKAAFNLLIASIILLFLYAYLTRNDQWFDFKDKDIVGKIKIPESIVASKDCSKFNEWQFNNIPPPMHGLCPWYEFTENYETSIGDLKLRIPRKYLLLPNETDAVTDIISTMDFIYPTLEVTRKIHKDGFWFSLEAAKRYENDDRFDNPFDKFFWCWLHVFEPKKEKNIIKYIGFNKNLGMNQYTTIRPSYDSKLHVGTFFTNDDPDNIQNAVMCHGNDPNVNCESFFKYKNIYVTYMFQQHLLYKPNNLKETIINIIKEWEIQ